MAIGKLNTLPQRFCSLFLMSPHLSSLSLGAMSVGWVGITAVGSEAEFFSETMRLKV